MSTRDIREHRMRMVAMLTRAGWSASAIGRELGITERTVTRYRRTLGISQPQVVHTQETKDLALALLQDGASYAEVARTVGCGDTTVAEWFPGYAWSRQQIGEWVAIVRAS